MIYTIHNGMNYSDSAYFFVDFDGFEDDIQTIIEPRDGSHTTPKVIQIMKEGELLVRSMTAGMLFFRLHGFIHFPDGDAELLGWVKELPVPLLRRLFQDYLDNDPTAYTPHPLVYFSKLLEKWFEENETTRDTDEQSQPG